MAKSGVAAREARWGKRMIELKVRFWTDSIADDPGKILPKHASGSGLVRLQRNDAHGIIPKKSFMFNSLMELPMAIEKALIYHGITIHTGWGPMKKYLHRAPN